MLRLLPSLPYSSLFLLFVLMSGCYSQNQNTNEGELRSLVWNMKAMRTAEEAGKSVSETVALWPSLSRWDLVFLQDDQYYAEELTVWAEFENWTEAKGIQIPTREALNIISRNQLEPVFRQQWEDCSQDMAPQVPCSTTAGFTQTALLLTNGHWIDVINVRLIDSDVSNSAVRASNVAQLIDFVNRGSTEEAMIVAGDFALIAIGETAADFQKVLEATGLQDSCTILNCSDERSQRFLFRSSDEITLVPTHWEVVTDLPAADNMPPKRNEPVEVWFAWEVTASE